MLAASGMEAEALAPILEEGMKWNYFSGRLRVMATGDGRRGDGE
jgi:hypothetical protein